MNNNLEWAHHFPTHIIKGFSDIVEGCIDHYESRVGLTGFVFEAGQHEDKKSVDHHEAMIWLVLQRACELNLNKLDEQLQSVSELKNRRASRKVFKIIHRHGIDEDVHFTMQPGFVNFQKIHEGELLASENGKPIYSRWDAHIFMPLYQKQGNDGFFVLDEV